MFFCFKGFVLFSISTSNIFVSNSSKFFFYSFHHYFLLLKFLILFLFLLVLLFYSFFLFQALLILFLLFFILSICFELGIFIYVEKKTFMIIYISCDLRFHQFCLNYTTELSYVVEYVNSCRVTHVMVYANSSNTLINFGVFAIGIVLSF